MLQLSALSICLGQRPLSWKTCALLAAGAFEKGDFEMLFIKGNFAAGVRRAVAGFAALMGVVGLLAIGAASASAAAIISLAVRARCGWGGLAC